MPVSVQDVHGQSLTISSAISRYSVAGVIAPLQVITVLNEAGVRFVLVGAHGLGGWMQRPRATEDVDVIVAARGHKKAVQALCAAFPDLEADDHDVVTRLRNPVSRKVVIDLMKPNQEFIKATLKNTHRVELEGQTFNIPSLEMGLTLKFAAMISLARADLDREQDALDFKRMVRANLIIDLEKLTELGQLVYNGGGAEIVQIVDQARSGGTMKI